jgi:lipopolysaccharide biosynthesis glycosyltransferase
VWTNVEPNLSGDASIGIEVEMNIRVGIQDSCVCYIANEGYLFQTLTSALQAKSISGNAADIILVNLTAKPTAETETVSEVCEKIGIIFITKSPDFLEGLPFVYSRMFFDEFLPSQYSNILYIDGDTQIVSDITPLVMMPIRPGFICAARDPMVFLNKAGALTDKNREEVSRIGDDYVNAGILRFDRSTWSSLSKDALALKRASVTKPVFEDQTVINIVAQNKIEFASISWNFPGFIMGYGFESQFPPKIVHFMSDPRPWQGIYAPWGKKWAEPYNDVTKLYQSLETLRSRHNIFQRAAYSAKQILKTAKERRTWRDKALVDSVTILNKSVVI